ncbi:MAG: hypothetical protein NTX50_09705 [Candidatus Sumerlaeota bacterium]|nr:hypothetical protein [Candidatus Sumerlaeota bacterium]
MITQQDIIEIISCALEQCGMAYMLAGSHGSSFYGKPRTTQDIDIIIDGTSSQIESFLGKIEKDFYVSRKMAMEALERRSMFNVIHLDSSWKVDLIFVKNRPYSLQEFARRTLRDYAGIAVFMVSAEDSILSKLEWAAKGESERQFRDAFNVAFALWDTIDKTYIEKWAKELGVMRGWTKIIEQVQKAGANS